MTQMRIILSTSSNREKKSTISKILFILNERYNCDLLETAWKGITGFQQLSLSAWTK